MISVDDILEAYDSSDETETTDLLHDAVDLDEILEEADDDNVVDDLIIDYRLSVQTREIQRFGIEIWTDSHHPTVEVVHIGNSLIDKIINEDENEVLKSQLFEHSDSEESKSTDHTTALERAKQREQKLFQFAKTPQSTTLRSKVSKTLVDEYSNIGTYELSNVSRQLQRNVSYHLHGPGIATSLLVHDIFVGIGTSKGLILLFDHNQEIRQVLGSTLLPVSRPSSAITSLDSSASGGLIVCGYESGEIALWDVGQAEILKVVTDLHSVKVQNIVCIYSVREGLSSNNSTNDSTDSWVLTVMSCDELGSVGKTVFTKRSSWTTAVSYVSESEHLFDRTILPANSIAALPTLAKSISTSMINNKKISFDRRNINSKYIELFGDSHLLAIDFLDDTIIAHTYPSMKILLKWNKHFTTVSDNTSSRGMSHLHWTWNYTCRECSTSHHRISTNNCKGSEEYMPVLARCCGGNVELLCVQANAGISASTINRPKDAANSFPSFAFLQPTGQNLPLDASSNKEISCKLIDRVEFPGQVFVMLKWLTTSQLVVISHSTILVLDSQLICLERFDFLGQQRLAAPFSSGFSRSSSGVGGGSIAGWSSSRFMSSAHNGQLYLSTTESVWKLHIESCFDKADAMIAMGHWLEALALISENVKKAASVSTFDKSLLEKYILSFVELAVNPQTSMESNSVIIDKEHRLQHFCFVAEICIEYCISCSLQEVLYCRIFPIFKISNRDAIFLQSLELYILSGAITELPTSVIVDFCEFALSTNRLSSIERCVVFFEVKCLDINFMISFLYQNRMFSSFLYVYSVGLHDFTEAFQIVFNCLPSSSPNNNINAVQLDDIDVGYKLLLFLHYTFDYKLFPRAQNANDFIDATTILSLMTLIARTHLIPLSHHLFSDKRHYSNLNGDDDALYPYLTVLCKVDPVGLFRVLTQGFTALQGTPDIDLEKIEDRTIPILSQVAALYDNIGGFVIYAKERKMVDDNDLSRLFYSSFEPLIANFRGHLSSQFLEKYVAFYANQPLLHRSIYENQLSHLMLQQVMVGNSNIRRSDLIDDEKTQYLHKLLLSNDFYIASLSIQPTSTLDYSAVDTFERAISFYISLARDEQLSPPLPSSHLLQATKVAHKTVDTPSIFKYIHAQFEFIEACSSHTQQYNVKAFFLNEVVKSLIQLGGINLSCCCKLVHKYLANHVSSIVEYTSTDLFIQFTLLDELVSHHSDDGNGENSTRTTSQSSQPHNDEASITAHIAELFSMEDLLTYFSLLCHCQPSRVLPFLRRFENYYPLDNYLTTCRKHGLSDAVSFLMEKSGEVMEALHMLLRDLSHKLKTARRDIDHQIKIELLSTQAQSNNKIPSKSLSISLILTKQGSARSDLVMRLPCYKDIQALVVCITELCSRHGEAIQHFSMWLTAFDHLLMERQTIRSGMISSSGEVVVALIGLMLQRLMDRMNGIIAPQEIMRRVTAQGNAAGIRLGEFKDMIMNMLRTNAQELHQRRVINAVFGTDVGQLHREKNSVMRRSTRYDDVPKLTPGFTTSYVPLQKPSTTNAMSSENKVNSMRDTFIASSKARYNRNKMFDFHQFLSKVDCSLADSSAADDAIGDMTTPDLLVAVPMDADRAGDYAVFEPTRPGTLNKKAMYVSQMGNTSKQ